MTDDIPARRTTRRYTILVLLVIALCGGWSALWYYAAGQAEEMLEGWRIREAEIGPRL